MLDTRRPLLISDGIFLNTTFYCFSQNMNALLAIYKNGNVPQFIGSIPNEFLFQDNLISAIHSWENSLIFIPRKSNSNKLWLYETVADIWTSIDIDFGKIRPHFDKISYSVIYKENLFLIGCYYNGIIGINLISREITYYPNLIDKNDEIHSLFFCKKKNNKLYIPSPNENVVSIFDFDTHEIERIEMKGTNVSFSGITAYNNGYWLSPRGKGLEAVWWDGNNNYKIYSIPEDLTTNGEYIFYGIFRKNNDIIMVGGPNGKSFVFSGDNFDDNKVIEQSYAFFKNSDDENYIYQDYDGNVIIGNNNNFCEFKLVVDMYELLDDINVANHAGEIINETQNIDLNIFLNL